jgi:D-alanyl-D-alanine carboxypeptidase
MVDWEKFPFLQQLLATRDILLPASAGHGAYALHNILSRLFVADPAVLGGKSGFTDDAGPCLIAMAARGGHHVIAVVMNARFDMVSQTRALLDWGLIEVGAAPPSPAPSSPAAPLHPLPRRH